MSDIESRPESCPKCGGEFSEIGDFGHHSADRGKSIAGYTYRCNNDACRHLWNTPTEHQHWDLS